MSNCPRSGHTDPEIGKVCESFQEQIARAVQIVPGTNRTRCANRSRNKSHALCESFQERIAHLERISHVFLLIVLIFPPPTLWADAIVVTKAMTATTIAEIYITEKAVRIELEIGVQGLDAFQNLLPDELYERLGHEPSPFKERLDRFFAEDWIIKTGSGASLEGWPKKKIEPRRRITRDEITGEPLPMPPDQGEPVVFVELEFPLTEKPRSLTFMPPVVPKDERPGADIGFIVYHEEIPVTDYRYLSLEQTLDLDWEDPWYSRFRNRNLLRQYSAPLSGFLYVDPFEVRKEIICRPIDLEHWIDLGLEAKKTIPVVDQEALKNKVAAFLATRNPVTIDGRKVEPKLDRIHFIWRSLKTSGVIDPPRDLPVISATLGVIFVYPIEELPKETTMTWELFTPRIQQVPTVATDEAGGMPWSVTPDDPVLRWENFLKNPTIPGLVDVAPPERARIVIPILSTACAVLLAFGIIHFLRKAKPVSKALYAAGLFLLVGTIFLWPFLRINLPSPFGGMANLPEEKARSIVTGLLKNVYHAFDYRDESLIYDTLARSASGDLLTRIYLETRRSLELENQGGARAKVKEIELLESRTTGIEGEPGFQSRCTWTVAGSVGHWGHIHMRRNRYDAVFTVMEDEGMWRISDLELLNEERL